MKEVFHRPLHRVLDDGLQAAKHAITTNLGSATIIYLAFLLTACLGLLIATPVGSGDTDLWYHLNGGRLLWKSADLPDTAFFSFTETPDSWVNYFWGFQAITYQIHNFGGYAALIALRALLVMTTILAVTALLLRPSDHPAQRGWALALLAIVVIIITGRMDLVRPHLVSYMMIALFLLVLERRQHWAPILPFLTLIWVNLHGIEWIIGAAISGAYFVENLWRWRQSGRSMDAKTRYLLLWILACVPLLLVNPYGIQILAAPFSTPPDVYAYIRELQPLSLATLTSPALRSGSISLAGAVAILFSVTLIGYLFVFLQGKSRIAPLLLSLAGLVLLLRGQRFIWEWTLLTLPFWRNLIDDFCWEADGEPRHHLRIPHVMMLLILASPFASGLGKAKAIHHWPLNDVHLPIGVTTFIETHDIKGRLMAPANEGGYLAWRLYPEVLISADMQTPPTTPWTHYRLSASMRNQHALERFVTEYDPELIAVAHQTKAFINIIAPLQKYQAVFFDDEYVLYANAEKLPGLVDKFALKHVNPYNLLDGRRGNLQQRLSETQNVLAQYPHSARAQHSIIRLLIEQQRYADALQAAQRFLEDHPQDPNSHILMGSALEKLDRCTEAIPHFDNAFAFTPEQSHSMLHLAIGSCAYLTRDFNEAFRHFDKAVNSYTEAVESVYLFQFALAAVAVGEEARARTLLRHLLYEVDPTDKISIEKAQALLDDL